MSIGKQIKGVDSAADTSLDIGGKEDQPRPLDPS